MNTAYKRDKEASTLKVILIKKLSHKIPKSHDFQQYFVNTRHSLLSHTHNDQFSCMGLDYKRYAAFVRARLCYSI